MPAYSLGRKAKPTMKGDTMTDTIYPATGGNYGNQTAFAGAPPPEETELLEAEAPKWSPHKALVPVILGVSAVLVQWVETGELNAAEVQTAIASIVTALFVFLVPNEAK